MDRGNLLVEKHSPKSFDDFIGHNQILQRSRQWINSWKEGIPEKPLLFYGPPGVGKTCLAYLIAKEAGWQMFELNASDFRNKDIIDKIVGGAAFNASFSGEKRLILLDEVDGIQKRKDRGGLQAITAILKNAGNPIILTANAIYTKDRKLDTIKNYCELIQFNKVMYTSIAKKLKEIGDIEDIDYDLECINALAKNSEGDVRAAISDLQNLCMPDKKITLQDVESNGFRERQTDVFKVLEKIFKRKNFKEIQALRFSVDIDSNLLKKWVEENIPRIYEGNDIPSAFNVLSRADIFDGRIYRRQHWGFLKYSTELASNGVAFAKQNEYHGWLKMQFPGILRSLSSSKSSRALKNSLAGKMSKKIHSSTTQIIRDDLPFLKMLFENNDIARELAAQFEFDEKEIAFLMNTKPERKKVQKLLEESQELRRKHVKPKPIKAVSVFDEKEDKDQESISLFGKENSEDEGNGNNENEEKTKPKVEENQTSLSNFLS